MSLLWRAAPAEDRALSYQDVWGRGLDVNLLGEGEGALALVPLFAAHRTIIDAVAVTPLHAYRERADGTKERLRRQPSLLTSPVFGTPFTWKAQCVASLLSDGNAFGFATSTDKDGRPAALVWLNPGEVHVDEDGPRPGYWWQGRPVPRERMVHIPWIVLAGKFRGISPLKAFKVAFEMGQAAQFSGRDWFAGGAIPSGHLKNTEMRLTQETADAAKSRFKAAVTARDVLVTGNDWDYATIGVPADEARFIEGLRLTATQVATIYGIAPEEIGGERGTSLTYSTLEQDDLRFNSRTVRPWAKRLEEAFTALLPRPQYALFNLDANVRADLKTRMDAHEVAQRAGVETNDEARLLEDRQPLSDAERAEWINVWHGKGKEPAEARKETT